MKVTRAPKHPLKALGVLLKEDDEYAWAFHCNVAMSIFDSSYINASIRECNFAASLLMKRIFNVDICNNPQWEQLGEEDGK